MTSNATVRFWARSLLVAIVAQLALLFANGRDNFDMDDFLWGLGGALVFVVAGLLGPQDPKVGVKYEVTD